MKCEVAFERPRVRFFSVSPWVVLGGGFTQGPRQQWSAQRGAIWPNGRLGDLGFRVARNASETRSFSQEVISAATEALRADTN
jgi:hypothetical protein